MANDRNDGPSGRDLQTSRAAGASGDESGRSAQSRGERYDEEQGGGRGVTFDGEGGVSDGPEDEEAARADAEFNREV